MTMKSSDMDETSRKIFSETSNVSESVLCKLSISIIFGIVSINFLFPSNIFIPLDRRMIGLLGAILCIAINILFLKSTESHEVPGKYVDFSVLIILLSIMIINFIMSHQVVVNNFINKMKIIIRKSTTSCDWKGFWLVSIISFLLSPFIMNDGI